MYNVSIERYDEETDTYQTFNLEVSLYVEPDEYEGGFLYSAGTIEVDECRCNGESFDLSSEEEEEIVKKLTDEEGISVPQHFYPKSW